MSVIKKSVGCNWFPNKTAKLDFISSRSNRRHVVVVLKNHLLVSAIAKSPIFWFRARRDTRAQKPFISQRFLTSNCLRFPFSTGMVCASGNSYHVKIVNHEASPGRRAGPAHFCKGILLCVAILTKSRDVLLHTIPNYLALIYLFLIAYYNPLINYYAILSSTKIRVIILLPVSSLWKILHIVYSIHIYRENL